MKKSYTHLIILAVMLFVISTAPAFAKPAREGVPIRLSTTTSTQDSGLLNILLPIFTRETGWRIESVAVGTGAALRMGRDGDADVVLVHAREMEEKFIEDGFGVRRFDVMYNDFLVVGPNLTVIPYNNDINLTFSEIASRNLPFVSRGDNSGTHVMENSLWRELGINPAALENYTSVGQGMGATLQMTYELGAYTLTDRATWLTLTRLGRINLLSVCEGDPSLLNYYGVIAVNPAKHPRVNAKGSEAFIEWLLKDSTQRIIGEYGVAEFGAALFTPYAQANR